MYLLVGRYELNIVLGRGGFGTVYKGKNKETDRVVAIKRIPKRHIDDKEIKFLKELQYDNVVAYVDYFVTPNNGHIVLEYCNGGDLANYIKKKKTLPEGTIKLFLMQISKALIVFKEKGIIHRDLKPQVIKYQNWGLSIFKLTVFCRIFCLVVNTLIKVPLRKFHLQI